MPLIDENRRMSEVQLLNLALRNQHILQAAHPKHGPQMWRCLRCSEQVFYENGEVLPSLIEDKCNGQPIVREEAVVDAVEVPLFTGDLVVTREPIPEVVFSDPDEPVVEKPKPKPRAKKVLPAEEIVDVVPDL